eukprot:15887993-Heterocapsa_arctica.AAC.1
MHHPLRQDAFQATSHAATQPSALGTTLASVAMIVLSPQFLLGSTAEVDEAHVIRKGCAPG